MTEKWIGIGVVAAFMLVSAACVALGYMPLRAGIGATVGSLVGFAIVAMFLRKRD